MDLRTLTRITVAMMPALTACGGLASIDLFFLAQSPPRDGSANLVLAVMEGTGSSQQLLDMQVEPFDADLEQVRVRVPFGVQREVIATLETDEPQPKILFSGRSPSFRLEESDSPTLIIDMIPVPAAGTVRIRGASAGRVSSATVALAIAGRDAFGVSISEDPSFPAARTAELLIADLPLARSDVFPPQFDVSATFVIDGRCEDRLGCARTLYFQFFDANAFASDVFSTTLIYDPFPPRLLEASLSLDVGAVLGGNQVARIITAFDEPAVTSVFALLSGGSAACPAQVEAVDGELSGLDFPLDCAGTFTIEITATDLAGNSVQLFDVAMLAVDRAPPPILDAQRVRSGCVGPQPVVEGGPGAAEARAIIESSAGSARADSGGAFVLSADAGSIEIVQRDAAGNASSSITFEVQSCGQ